MLGIGALLGLCLAFIGLLDNRIIGLLGLGAAIVVTNAFTVGIVIGYFVSSGVLSNIEGHNLHWRTKVSFYCSGVLFSVACGTIFFISIITIYSPSAVLQTVLIIRIIAWVWEILANLDKITFYDIIGIPLLFGLAWFGITQSISAIAFLYFSVLRLNVQHNVDKVINKELTEEDNNYENVLIMELGSNIFKTIWIAIATGLFEANCNMADDNDTSGYDAIYQGFKTGIQYVMIGLVASQRDILNTILQLDLGGDAAFIFIVLCVVLVLLTKLLLGEWFINIYEFAGRLRLFQIIGYISIIINIALVTIISPYGMVYCLAGVFICNLCSKWIRRMSTSALACFGVFIG